jgi:hypothetical protein
VLLKNANIFYVFLDTFDHSQNKYSYSVKKSDLNQNGGSTCVLPTKNFKHKKMFKTLVEGIWENDVFYLTDILLHNNVLVEQSYSVRYSLLKKILEEMEYNNVFSLAEIYQNISLEDIISTKKNNIDYIFLKKNFYNYLLECPNFKSETNVSTNVSTNSTKPNILLQSPFSVQKGKFLVSKTDKNEIYAITHSDLGSKTYSILRIVTIKDSKKIKELFSTKKSTHLKLTYNHNFKKYEFDPQTN